jgi:signal transduction histidine kinase
VFVLTPITAFSQSTPQTTAIVKPVAPPPLTIKQAQARFTLAGSGQTIERVVTLPHRWDRDFPGKYGVAVYEITLPPDHDVTQPSALFIPRVGNRGTIKLGDETKLVLGTQGSSLSDLAKRPHLLLLPHSRAGENRLLTVELEIDPGRWGGLSSLDYGSLSALTHMYKSHLLWRNTGSTIVASISLAAGLAVLGLWWKTRDPLFLAFAIASIAWSLRVADRSLESVGLPWPAWGILTNFAWAVYVAALSWFVLQLIGKQRFARYLILFVIASAVVTVFYGLGGGLWVWSTWLGVMLGMTAVLTVWVLVLAWRKSDRILWMIVVGGVATLATALNDFFGIRLAESAGGRFSFTPYSTLLFILLMGWIVIERFAKSMDAEQRLIRNLQITLEERERELKSLFEQREQQVKSTAAQAERERLVRDVHDGLGGHLIGLVGAANDTKVSQKTLAKLALGALAEFRASLHTIASDETDLQTALANMRYAIQTRLETAGIAVEWDVGDLQPVSELDRSEIFQIQKIVTEAVTNVMKHARCTRLRIEAQALGPREFWIAVSDDGLGFDPAAVVSRGLDHMRKRANTINGNLRFSGGIEGKGSRIELICE